LTGKDKTVPKKKTIDSDKLLEMVDKGVPDKEIMNRFGIRTLSQLKSYYMDALMEKGRVPGLPGRTVQAGPGKETMTVRVNKRGSLILPKKMIEALDLAGDESFKLRKTRSGINLKKE